MGTVCNTCSSSLSFLIFIQSLQNDYFCRSLKTSIMQQLFSWSTLSRSVLYDRQLKRRTRLGSRFWEHKSRPLCFNWSSQTFWHWRRVLFECWISSDEEVDVRIIAAPKLELILSNCFTTFITHLEKWPGTEMLDVISYIFVCDFEHIRCDICFYLFLFFKP